MMLAYTTARSTKSKTHAPELNSGQFSLSLTCLLIRPNMALEKPFSNQKRQAVRRSRSIKTKPSLASLIALPHHFPRPWYTPTAK